MSIWNEEIQRLLDESVAFHGHLCSGQVIGVRMAVAALKTLGMENPKGPQGRDLVIYAESDRCPMDAVISVTGRTPGKRSVRMMDYGKTAATFCETTLGKAVRISLKGDIYTMINEIIRRNAGKDEKFKDDISVLKHIDDGEFLHIEKVSVEIPVEDLPGSPMDTVICARCGELVKDLRHVVHNGEALCLPCATNVSYYTPAPDDSDDTCGSVVIIGNPDKERN